MESLDDCINEVAQRYRSYINEEPGLLSLLYDVDLLPEQLLHVLSVNPSNVAVNAMRMSAICELWKQRRDPTVAFTPQPAHPPAAGQSPTPTATTP